MGYDYFDESNRFRNWPNYLAGFLGAALLMGAIVMVFYPSLQRSLVQEEQTETDESDEMLEPESMMLMLPGINKPKIRSIAEVEIDDQAEIIGIAGNSSFHERIRVLRAQLAFWMIGWLRG